MEINPPWMCDQCGQPIFSVEEGWVEWLNGASAKQWEGHSHELRLVHARAASPRPDSKYACGHNEDYWREAKQYSLSDLPLSCFIGPDGLVTLLSWLADKRFAEPEEVLEMIKRLHVPNYEAARPSFDAAIAEGAFEQRSAARYYDQRELAAVLAWAARQPHR